MTLEKKIESLEHLKELNENDLHWHWEKFFIGCAKMWTSPEFFTFIIFTGIIVLDHIMGWSNGHTHYWTVGYIIVACIFMLKKSIESLITNIGKRADFKVSANIGVGK